jgi:hypothetical protein
MEMISSYCLWLVRSGSLLYDMNRIIYSAEKGDIFEQREQAWIGSGRGDNWIGS